MNYKLLQLKKELSKLKPSTEDMQGKLLQDLTVKVRNKDITFNEYLEGFTKAFRRE